MLHDFLTTNRKELIKRCRDKVAKRFEPAQTPAAIDHGVPLFLQQLVDTLRLEQSTHTRDMSAPERTPAPTEIGRGAAIHGAELLRLGYTVDQVVHDYGDVCQAVTELAVEQKAPIAIDEFRTLNRCLDNAIADAVTAFGRSGQTTINDRAETLNKRLDHFAEEQRRLVDIAIRSYNAIKTGSIGLSGSTGTLLTQALDDLRSLADRCLPEILLASATTTLAPPKAASH
ncbi:MAG: hypothetical protein QOK44_4312 [Betaproteobacteria bacterium]|jgi:hypothetical protein|nr:hypothetical protein [Betaproteobacteria bacterium]